MTILNLEENKCHKGRPFDVELFCATSTVDNPELKEALMAGEINFVFCPYHNCGEMFYAERFVLYHDSDN
ncbi:hypothetical protein AGMMS49593_00250 [Endomicrobiia bacterium]|nr:hypothetical protein AGMMS49593_00250 [Endomicrobiia bacterium]